MFYDIKSLIYNSEDFYEFENNSSLLLSSLAAAAQKGVNKNKQTPFKNAFDWLSLKASE